MIERLLGSRRRLGRRSATGSAFYPSRPSPYRLVGVRFGPSPAGCMCTGAAERANTSLPDNVAADQSALTPDRAISTPKPGTGQPGRETLEISEFFRSLLRSNALAGPTSRCPPDE